ncbi:MAG TPA: BTAD domain-containing putative transcriptional regulator [Acidimicrobiales bacterium]|nr:BTAD domain-containing putative transcriptional regulator [Acidimicrobiales bacterium]
MLLAAGGRVVTAEALVDILWGEDPPASAPGTLQSYISRLRRELEPDRARGTEARVLVWEPPGYRLAVEAGDVDFRRFEALADEGRALLGAGRAGEERNVLLAADALWRGPALAEYRDRDFAVGSVARLEDRRLAATEDRIGAELALGRHAAVVGELAEVVNAHLLSPAAVPGGEATAVQVARFALVEAVADLLARSAAARPVVLVLDDLQWADVESLELLTSVVGRLADAPVLIVGTVRELEVGRRASGRAPPGRGGHRPRRRPGPAGRGRRLGPRGLARRPSSRPCSTGCS